MRILSIIYIVTTLHFSIISSTAAQPSTKNLKVEIQNLVSDYYNSQNYHGSILVANSDGIIYQAGFGNANESSKNNVQTVYKIGSLTKAFTATIILKLEEEGLIDLEATLDSYLDEFETDNVSKIKVKHLLNFSSGLQNYTMNQDIVALHSRGAAPKQLVSSFIGQELLFEPGTKRAYCNAGYTLLGYLAEKITGDSYATLLREYIFKPLNMTNSYYLNSDSETESYNASGDKQQVYQIHLSIPFAAGAIESTVEDLYVFYQALFNGELLSENAIQNIQKINDHGYSCGWFFKDTDEFTVVNQGGKVPGFHSRVSAVVKDGIYIISLNNISQAKLRELHIEILSILGYNL
ncbi:MAG: serine hydrolase domain-containing protein [Fulvivirga sp.]|uniref:serine hydrolase domain-containing protein n=1 Tax=Fulvivirga sp. TaxID=1931237 RepID=UPI0032EB11F2